MKGELLVFPDAAAAARAAATHFVDIAQASITLNRRFSVALSGGETPQAMHRLLATDEFSRQIDWRYVHLFWSDERCVPPDHPDSNYKMAWDAFIDHVPVSTDNIHRILGEHDPIVAAEAYEQELKEHFNAALPRFDLIFLGIGADGHTASLFPGIVALEETKHLALAVQHPQSNQWRVTLTLPVLNAAANVAFIVTGGGKAGILQQMKTASGPLIPAARVKPSDGQLRLFVDREAADRLA